MGGVIANMAFAAFVGCAIARFGLAVLGADTASLSAPMCTLCGVQLGAILYEKKQGGASRA